MAARLWLAVAREDRCEPVRPMAVTGPCVAGDSFVFEQQPLREGRQLLHCLDLTHAHTVSTFAHTQPSVS